LLKILQPRTAKEQQNKEAEIAALVALKQYLEEKRILRVPTN
jgi:hypothetical protein